MTLHRISSQLSQQSLVFALPLSLFLEHFVIRSTPIFYWLFKSWLYRNIHSESLTVVIKLRGRCKYLSRKRRARPKLALLHSLIISASFIPSRKVHVFN